MGAGRALGQHGGGERLHSNDPDARITGFKVLAHACDGASGTHARHKNIRFAFCIIPDFRACGAEMRFRVGRVGELAGNKAVGQSRGQFLRLGDGSLHAQRAVRQHQFRAVGFQEVAAFHAHRLRHGQYNPVPA